MDSHNVNVITVVAKQQHTVGQQGGHDVRVMDSRFSTQIFNKKFRFKTINFLTFDGHLSTIATLTQRGEQHGTPIAAVGQQTHVGQRVLGVADLMLQL